MLRWMAVPLRYGRGNSMLIVNSAMIKVMTCMIGSLTISMMNT